MKPLKHQFINKITVGTALLLACGSIALTPAQAAQELKNLDQPLTVEIKTPIDSKTTPKGSAFEAVLSEDYTYNNGILPAGTKLIGHIADAKSPKVFARAGYLVLEVNEAHFPSGEIRHLISAPVGTKVKNPNATSFGKFVKKNGPITAVSLGTSLPLKFATGLSGGIVTPIVLGAKMATGAVMDIATKEHPNESFPRQLVHGIWRGTGVPGAVELVSKGKEAHFEAGDKIAIQLDPNGLKDLFMVKSITPEAPTANVETPAETKASQFVPEVKQPESATTETPTAAPDATP